MKYPVIYIKGKGSHTARFSEMVEGRMYVVGDIGSAMRTLTSLRTDHAFILYEQRDPAADLSDIRLLNSWPGGGIVLITSRELTERERREYLRAGVNSAIAGDMPRKDFLRMLQFMGDYAFTHKPAAQNSPEVQIFRMPLWKRAFDIAASLSAILLLSPLLIVVAAAIKLDSPGPVVYKSKRVGSNYRIFDFLKFRSMRTDADRRLKELGELNQYAAQPQEADSGKMVLGEEEMRRLLEDTQNGMLYADDFVIAEETHTRSRPSRKRLREDRERSPHHPSGPFPAQIQHRRAASALQHPAGRHVGGGQPPAAALRSRTPHERRIYRTFHVPLRPHGPVAGRETRTGGQTLARTAQAARHRVRPQNVAVVRPEDNSAHIHGVHTERKRIKTATMKRAVFTLWLLLTAVAATAQGNSPDFEFGYSDLQRLSPDDYISLQLPPLHQLLENARNTPQVEYYNKAVEIQERELKNVRRNWQHYFKLNANYNYGSSDIYNQNYQDNSNQIWTTTTTGREQSWWNVGASFSLPIDEIFNRRNKIKQQKRRIEQVELDTERWLEEQRIKVIQQYTLAVQQLSVLRSAVEAMVTAQAQYRLSEADFINGKLDAQTLSRQKNIENVAIREYEEVRRSLNNALLTLEVLTRTPIISQPAPATDAQAPKTE